MKCTHPMISPPTPDASRASSSQIRSLHSYNTVFAKTQLITITCIKHHNRIIACILHGTPDVNRMRRALYYFKLRRNSIKTRLSENISKFQYCMRNIFQGVYPIIHVFDPKEQITFEYTKKLDAKYNTFKSTHQQKNFCRLRA